MDYSDNSVTQVETKKVKSRNPIKRLYEWILGWADSYYGGIALFMLAFTESSFFPIPPDVLLIALCLGKRKKAFKFVAICTAGSVLGAALGYLIGATLSEPVAKPFLNWSGLTGEFATVQGYYQQYDVLAVAVAAFTPIPYKVFTIGAGLCKINFALFIIVSFIFRGLRFLIQGALIYRFGKPVKTFIDKYFNILTIAAIILLVAVFLFIKKATTGDKNGREKREQIHRRENK